MSTHAALPGSDAFAGLDAGAVLDALDAVSDLVVIADASGQITAMNRAARSACDVDDDPSGLIGRSFAEVFGPRSEEHTSELQSLMRNSYAVFCLQKKTTTNQ